MHPAPNMIEREKLQRARRRTGVDRIDHDDMGRGLQ